MSFLLKTSWWDLAMPPCIATKMLGTGTIEADDFVIPRVMPFVLPFSSIPGVKVRMVLGADSGISWRGIQILVYKVVNR